MKIKKIGILLCVFLFVMVFSGCSTKEERLEAKLDKYDESYEKILAVCTKEFIGNHPIDDNFMVWFIGQYGEADLDNIVDNMDFENPDVWYSLTGKSIHVLWYEYCLDTGIESYDLNYIHQINTASKDEIVMDFSGDLTMADGAATTAYMNSQPNGLASCFSNDLLDEMITCDIFMINNEFAYTTRGTPTVGKAYTFRSNPSNVSELNKIGVDIVSLANNHVYDYGAVGLTDTLNTLKDADMPYVGAGENLEEASIPQYFIANGKKIAIVSATQIERSYTYTKEADATSSGVLKTLKPAYFCSVIKKAKENADYVIVMCHWGTEGNANYGSDQNSLAQKFVEAGADAIIGGHTHCLQGVDYIDGVPVYYSLGNYLFSTTMNMPADYDTGLAQLKISNDKITADFIPCHFSAGKTSLVTDKSQKNEIIDGMNKYSGNAYINNDGVLTEK